MYGFVVVVVLHEMLLQLGGGREYSSLLKLEIKMSLQRVKSFKEKVGVYLALRKPEEEVLEVSFKRKVKEGGKVKFSRKITLTVSS